MPNGVAYIVIDSGFDAESLAEATTVLGLYDLHYNWNATGLPWLDGHTLKSFADDPLKHGSLVLKRVRQLAPHAPLILIRAFDQANHLIRTRFEDGKQVAPGWTEAYIWAVELCQSMGLASVANCSFGGFTHALDGTGWESFQVGRVSGIERSGHVIVAAAGPGDGRAAHASWRTLAGQTTTVQVFQKQTTRYNFWTSPESLPGPKTTTSNIGNDWVLEIWLDDNIIQTYRSKDTPVNFWNERTQVTFTVEGSGLFQLKLTCLKDRAANSESQASRFDCWLMDDEFAAFLDHVDPVLICEPAVFPQVISVGLRAGSYSPKQTTPGEHPHVLIDGAGPISFRLPEVTVLVGSHLEHDAKLDVAGMRALLGKYPMYATM